MNIPVYEHKAVNNCFKVTTGADELWAIIDCNGDYKKELEIIER